MGELGPVRPTVIPDWLVEALRHVYLGIASVQDVFVVSCLPISDPTRDRLLVFIGAKPADSERAAWASITDIQGPLRDTDFGETVDLTVYASDRRRGPILRTPRAVMPFKTHGNA